MSAIRNTRQAGSTRLDQLSPGTKFRLFAKYRDGSPRPRLKYNDTFLAAHELEVESIHPGYVLVRAAGKSVPVTPDLRVVSR